MNVQIRQAQYNRGPRQAAPPYKRDVCALLGILLCWQTRALRASRERLRQERNSLRTILDTIPEQIFLKDAQARFVYCNKAFADFAGCSEAELVGKTSDVVFLEAFLAGQGLGGACDPLEEAAPEQISVSEDWITYPDGRRGQVETVRLPYTSEQGETLGTLGISRDISRFKELESELRCICEAAQTSDRAKSQFLARMSHEIRTPMNGIIGMTYLALESSPPEALRHYFERIQYSSTSLLRILNDILDLSKMEADKMEIERVCYNLELLLTMLMDSFEGQAQKKGLRLELDFDPTLPDLLFGDPQRINQMLLNLMSNALKFTGQGAITLRVTTARHPVTEAKQLHFMVSDTGIGMTREHLNSLFAPYVQGGSHISRRFGGTGLGLVISRRLARLMGGDIWAESVPDQGSVFHLYLPFELGDGVPAPDPSKAKVPEDTFKGFRALLVEDNEINQEIALALLERMGLMVDLAPDGEQAVAKVVGTRYDIILMDIQMPIMDGLTATRHIRLLPDRADVPVLALSATVMSEERQASLDAGMNDFISKPFSPTALYDTLHKWLFRDRQ